MKIKPTTNLKKYGFKKDSYGYWIHQVPDYTGKGSDQETPLRFEIVVSPDLEIYFYATNDHVQAPYDDPDKMEHTYFFEESFDIPEVVLDLIKDNQIISKMQIA